MEVSKSQTRAHPITLDHFPSRPEEIPRDLANLSSCVNEDDDVVIAVSKAAQEPYNRRKPRTAEGRRRVRINHGLNDGSSKVLSMKSTTIFSDGGKRQQ